MNKIMHCVLLLAVFFLPAAIAQEDKKKPDPGLNKETFAGLELRSIGPAFMSGRIADIAIDPNDINIRYVAVGSGGVWKTINAGITWEPVFHKEESYSVGAITIDPNDSNTIWVGSGENVSGRHVAYGDGVYVSHDAGKSWKNKGLKKSEHIGMISIDPRDSNTVFVAAQGPLWSLGGERGLYKTTDGGETWKRVLKGNQYTGAGEVHIDPNNPDILYATTWQRMRSVAVLMDGGPDSGIHKSVDAGETWEKLKSGLPETDMGKIGLAISPLKPNVVYATIELPDRKGAFYKSTTGGASFDKQSDYAAGGTGPHYYNEIFASPHVFDRIYHMDVFMNISNDGGKTFVPTNYNDKHVDHHALAFNPKDPEYLLVGTDGGLYESFDHGDNWRYTANLPVTQYYKVAVDYDLPFYNVYGGTQDNNSQGGPSRTQNANGIRDSDWFVTLGGDGHQSAADPDNPDIVYAQWQQGNLTRFDRKSGETVFIKPQPGADEPFERFNWDAPVLISPHDSKTLYFGSARVWKSNDRGDSWSVISPDLSRNIDRLQVPVMGRKWNDNSLWDLYAMSMYSTITSLSESPLEAGLLYAGTDDGLIQVSENGGKDWRKIDSLPGVPDNFFVNDIKADLHDKDTVYVAVDQHKNGDYTPYLLKSTDRGRKWKSISSNLPERHLVWRIVQDHVKPELMFTGTEFGVFFTIDSGKRWTKLTGNTPTIAFRDLAIQQRENDLVGATFGRGFYILDDYSALRHIDPDTLATAERLYPVRKAPWYIPKQPIGCDQPNCRSSRGSAFFQAPNPPFGAIFTYYLGKELKSTKKNRHDAQAELAKAGTDTPFPDWQSLNQEEMETDPSVVLIIKDANGKTVRRVDGPVKAGFNRTAWDLRRPSKAPYEAPEDPTPWNSPPVGALVAPGTYSVTFAKRIDGKLEVSDQVEEFVVEPIRQLTLAGASQEDRLAYLANVEETIRVVSATGARIGEAIEQLDAAMAAQLRSIASAALLEQTTALTKQLKTLKLELSGNETRARFNQEGKVSIEERTWVSSFGGESNTYGPTQTQRMSLEIAQKQLTALKTRLNPLLDTQIPALMKQLDEAGVAWSKGR